MTTHEVVSKGEWVEARKRLLAKEKEFTRMREQLSAERRALPWMRIDKDYTFDGPNGRETLAQLFGDRSQLVVYHFMFAPEWEVGCKSCSFWADNFNGITAHLRQRDVAFAAISRAPLAKLQAFAQRLGWTFQVGILARHRFQLRLRGLVQTRGPGPRRRHLQLRQAPARQLRTCPASACSQRTRAARSFARTRPSGAGST